MRLPDQRVPGDHCPTTAGTLAGRAIVELTWVWEPYLVYEGRITRRDQESETQRERFANYWECIPCEGSSLTKKQKNTLNFNVRIHLYRMTGVDLPRFDGVGTHTAPKVVSNIRLEMNLWQTAGHFNSWWELSPNNGNTDGKVINSRTKLSANRAARSMLLAPNGQHRLGSIPASKENGLGNAQTISATTDKLT